MRDPWETDEPVKEDPPVTPENSVNSDHSASAPSDQHVALHRQQIEKAKPVEGNNPSQSQPDTVKSIRPPGFLTLNRDNFLQGIVWAEILGKPLSKRGRR